MNKKKLVPYEIGGESPTNGAASAIVSETPYMVDIRIRGLMPLIMHRWNVEAVAEKAAAKKGSESKKTDNIESYVYRDGEGRICIPGAYLRGAIVTAARFKQDPRSPRKSAIDLYKAGILVEPELSPVIGDLKEWDFIDQRRCVVNRAGITRSRPALKAGWELEFEVQVLTPEYINENDLRHVLDMAAKFSGLGDHRPTYGRFAIVSWRRRD